MSTPHGPLELSVGASTGAKIGVALFAIPFIGVPLFVISRVVRADELFSERLSLGLSFLSALVPLAVMVVFLVNALGTFRFRAVLTGSVLEVRQTFTTRSADLARATVWLDSSPEYLDAGQGRRPTGRRIPHLYAQEPGGARIRIRLRTAGGFLPPHELVALADAVESGRRTGPEAERASQAADLLRRLGTDPITRIL
ncbi:hypothetical protein AB0B56_29535 [Streptosporangium canum]|uniref:hypothetical protein n=1 Tax=Streptosporangium canum TaxID=324952 RepID=UPI00341C95CD